MRKRALFFYPISKDRTLNKKRVPSFKGTLSWGTWIRTKIPSSRGTCTAVVRFPKTAVILPLFSFFVGNFTPAFTAMNLRDLFTCSAAGVIFDVHENQQDLPNRLQTDEIPQAGQCGLKDPEDLLREVGKTGQDDESA